MGSLALTERAQRIKLLVLDVDGVLTDRRIILGSHGIQYKAFDVQDGFGLVLARKAGLKIALITAERSQVVTRRARQLKVDWVAQFARDKAKAFVRCLAHFKVPASRVAWMGDDLLDLPIVTQAGLSASPDNACPDVKKRVHYVARAEGGRGAVRELVELILRAQGRWGPLVKGFLK